MPPDKTHPDAQRELDEPVAPPTSQQSAVTLGGAVFRLTSFACPEQYDVDLGEAKNRGYVRLRHGELTADYLPDGDFSRAVPVFERDIGDHAGCFESDEERDRYLTEIAAKLHGQHRAHATAARDTARQPRA